MRDTSISDPLINNHPIIKTISDVTNIDVENSKGAIIKILLGSDDKMPNFYTRQFTIEPNGRIPEHIHDTIEHEQVIIKGEMVVCLDGKESTVKAGQCIYIPKKCAHWYENRSSEPIVFLCIIPANAEFTTKWLEPPCN